MNVAIDQVEGRVIGDQPSQDDHQPRRKPGATTGTVEHVVREIDRARRLEDRLKAT